MEGTKLKEEDEEWKFEDVSNIQAELMQISLDLTTSHTKIKKEKLGSESFEIAYLSKGKFYRDPKAQTSEYTISWPELKEMHLLIIIKPHDQDVASYFNSIVE